MDDILYIIIIITLSIIMVFFGGHNNQEKIEYNSDYFNNLNSIVNFEKKIKVICSKNENIFREKNFININKYLNVTKILIQNFTDCFLIKINPNDLFNIYNIIDKTIAKLYIMIIFNHDKYNNLELLLNYYEELDIIDQYKSSYKYFYNLKKNISITGIYHIYNNSNQPIVITCFIIKKPFWYK